MFGGINQIRAAAEHIGQPDADRQRDRNRNHRAAPCRQFAVQRLEAKQRAVHQRTNQTGHQSQRNQPHILFQRQLTDITEIQNRTQTETVFRDEIGGQRCGSGAHQNRRGKTPMHPFQSEHHAGQRRAERGGQACRGTGGDQIMLLHVLTAVAAQTVGHTLRSRRTNLNGRPLTAERQTKQRAQQSTDETDWQNRLPTHLQAAYHHAVGLRDAAATGHRLLADHPRDRQRGRHRGNRPRRNQPRGLANPRIYPAGRIRAVFDAETVYDDQQS